MLKITDNIKLGKLVGSSSSSGGSSGSSNYNDLENKPSINGVSLDGNKTSADLGVLDLNTTNPQFIKSALYVEQGLVIMENNEPTAILACDRGVIGLGSMEGKNELQLASQKTVIFFTPIIERPTALADLQDNAILTKAQVQEMINNALNNS